MSVLATYVGGEKVFDRAEPFDESEMIAIAKEHDGMPWGLTVSPILGYDPTPGILLGGADLLRGYLNNRFRGDAFTAATGELRIPIWSFISGAAFTEAGRVFLLEGEDDGPAIGMTSGFGLRFGLPPDGLIKLRFDAGFARDGWGLFFKFGEAF